MYAAALTGDASVSCSECGTCALSGYVHCPACEVDICTQCCKDGDICFSIDFVGVEQASALVKDTAAWVYEHFYDRSLPLIAFTADLLWLKGRSYEVTDVPRARALMLSAAECQPGRYAKMVGDLLIAHANKEGTPDGNPFWTVRNDAEAEAWMRRGAAAGDVEAMVDIFCLRVLQEEPVQAGDDALEMLNKAIDGGCTEAMTVLAAVLLHGGVHHLALAGDPERARQLYRLAKSKGNTTAAAALAALGEP